MFAQSCYVEQGDTHAAHEAEYPDLASLSVFIDSPWSAWTEVNIAFVNITVIRCD